MAAKHLSTLIAMHVGMNVNMEADLLADGTVRYRLFGPHLEPIYIDREDALVLATMAAAEDRR